MIVPMKKITVVVQSKDTGTTLKELGKTGVLHIEHQNVPVSNSIAGIEEKYRLLSEAIRALPEAIPRESTLYEPEKAVSEILNLINEKEILRESLKKTKKNIEAWKVWGDFDPELIDDLNDKNIRVRLCKLTKSQIQDIPEGIILEQLFKKGTLLYCAAISREDVPLPFETLSLPEEGLGEMLAVEEREEQRVEEIDKILSEAAGQKEALSLYGKKLSSLIEFKKVAAGMGRFESLSYLRGYCPVNSAGLLERTAAEKKWGLIIENPGENDNVPTLIKNPRLVEIIRPVFNIIKTIPGYKEVDVSAWFLLFFSVFFGMLIGDAGYGLVFFIINLICHIKFRKGIKDKSIFFLTYVLSLCAVTWGILTGTFFGQAYLPERVEPLLPYLRESANVQSLCFFIGALHLSIAHLWRFIRKFPSLKAFSETGWIAMLWAAYFLAKSLILGETFPVFGKWLLIGGAGSIILFTNPRKNILKGIGAGIGDFLLNIINSFTDVVSYIRLFAVGAATVAVADAFNQMAFSIGYSNIFMGFLTALVLLFGHTLNIALGAMAILVHGVRLNVLEFSSHLNMEWLGVEYAPFKAEGD